VITDNYPGDSSAERNFVLKQDSDSEEDRGEEPEGAEEEVLLGDSVQVAVGEVQRAKEPEQPPQEEILIKEDVTVPISEPVELIGPEKGPRLSPLLERHEKREVMDLGHSLDAKKVTSALGYLDLKQICFCLANALMRHVEFSRGNSFIQDLRADAETANADNRGAQIDVEFSYKLGGLKIDVDEAKRNAEKRAQKEQETKLEVEKLQRAMENSTKKAETDKARALASITPKLTASKAPASNIEDEVEEEIKDESGVDDQEDFYEDDFEEEPKQPVASGELADLDMDYSQTQLDEFLKSQANGGLSS
jgi:hypothetical protein